MPDIKEVEKGLYCCDTVAKEKVDCWHCPYRKTESKEKTCFDFLTHDAWLIISHTTEKEPPAPPPKKRGRQVKEK